MVIVLEIITPAIVPSQIVRVCIAIYIGNICAKIESVSANACDATRNRYGGQTGATLESIISNAGDAVGNGDACQIDAFIERRLSNACDAARDNRILTTGNKRMG
jgi:hypothetical protein